MSPLTPPASESSSDTEQSSSYMSESSNSTKSVKRKSKNTKLNRNGDAKVYAMTIFDSVMINDGRTKKGNGEAEIIHVEEKRQGRYKCPLCGKSFSLYNRLQSVSHLLSVLRRNICAVYWLAISNIVANCLLRLRN